MTTAFEQALSRAIGDWMGPENPLSRCKKCSGYHEEPVRVLMALTGWPCDRADKYHREVFDRCIDRGLQFTVMYRRFQRLAPHWRKGGHLGARYGVESDAEYTQRMLDLKASPPDWDLMLHEQEKKGVNRIYRTAVVRPGRVRRGRKGRRTKPPSHRERSR